MKRCTPIIFSAILTVFSLIIGAALHNIYNVTIDNIRRLEQQNKKNDDVSNDELMKELKKLGKKVKSVQNELKRMKKANKDMAEEVSTAKEIALAFDACWNRVCPTEGPTSIPSTSPTSIPSTSPTTSPLSIRDMLEDFYEGTDGLSWHDSYGWMTVEPYCTWYGINCVNGKLSIILNTNQLAGTIPESFGGLTDLEVLHLDSNQITGTFPEALGSLTNLQQIHLGTFHFVCLSYKYTDNFNYILSKIQ